MKSGKKIEKKKERRLGEEEVDILIKECCDPEDDDGFIPYEPFLRRVCAGPHPEMYEDW